MKILVGILLTNAITLACSKAFYPPNFFLKGPTHQATIYGVDGSKITSVADAGSISTKGVQGAKFTSYTSGGNADSSQTVVNNCSKGGCGSDSGYLEGDSTQYNPSVVQGQSASNSNPYPAAPDVVIIGPTASSTINGPSDTNPISCHSGCSKGSKGNEGYGSSYHGESKQNLNTGNGDQITPYGSASSLSSNYGQVPYSNNNGKATDGSDNQESEDSSSVLGNESLKSQLSQNSYQDSPPNTHEYTYSSGNVKDTTQDQNKYYGLTSNIPTSSLPQSVEQTHYSSGNSYLPPKIEHSPTNIYEHQTYDTSSFAPAAFEQSDKTNSGHYPAGTSSHSNGAANFGIAGETHPYDFGSDKNGFGSSTIITSQVLPVPSDQDASVHSPTVNGGGNSDPIYYESSSFAPATYSEPNSVDNGGIHNRNLKNYDCYVIKFPISSSSGYVVPAEYGLFLKKLASFNFINPNNEINRHLHHHQRHY